MTNTIELPSIPLKPVMIGKIRNMELTIDEDLDGVYEKTLEEFTMDGTVKNFKKEIITIGTKTHCSMQQLERLDDMARPKKMALIHVNRTLRKDKNNVLKKYKQRRWIMPEPGDVINL